jgi:folate-binding protein YgfZ
MLRLETTPEALASWQQRPHVIARPDVILRVDGPGAVACVQGIFTNDIERAGSGSLSWGAVLTPKGMIISDLWVWRRDTDLLLILPEAGVADVLALLRKSFPPRLAKVTSQQQEWNAWWLVGGDAPLPAGVEAVKPGGPAPFGQLALAPASTTASDLESAGWQVAPGFAADCLALLAGWPVVGREIDARTLVQEVRFDELQGVHYDKGCYVGQETVSRLHFRGHPNRALRAVMGRGPAPADETVRAGTEQRDVGTLATLLTIASQWIGSVKLRREVETGETVSVGGHDATVHDFPIAWSDPG